MNLHYLFFKVEKEKLEVLEERVVYVLRFLIGNQKNAFLRCIENVLIDALSFDYVLHKYFKFINPVVEYVTKQAKSKKE